MNAARKRQLPVLPTSRSLPSRTSRFVGWRARRVKRRDSFVLLTGRSSPQVCPPSGVFVLPGSVAPTQKFHRRGWELLTPAKRRSLRRLRCRPRDGFRTGTFGPPFRGRTVCCGREHDPVRHTKHAGTPVGS